jgi:uncharacterized protein
MKKVLFTLSAITLFLGASAQRVITETYSNGAKKSEGIVLGNATIDANAPKEEQAREMSKITKDGKWTTWHENGKVRSVENYSNGAMVGVWQSWYDNGQLESDVNYTSGTAVFYYNTGKVNSKGSISSGAIHKGKWIGYYESGVKNYEGAYTNEGQKDGLWIWYNEKGVKTTEQTYNNGNLVNTVDFTKK